MLKIVAFVKEQYLKYQDTILYLFFGAATTLINTVCYALLYEVLDISNLISTVAAWLFSVIFAFITNKIFVFKSKKTQTCDVLIEAVGFFGCRILTGILDVAVMFVFVDCLKQSGIVWKLLSNFLVIIINFFASKFLIFKK